MASFYGNIKNNSRSSFIFDRIYSSRCEMEKALYETKDANGAIAGDGVFINRYVLINYGYAVNGTYTLVYLTSDENCEINASNYSEYYYIQDSSIHPQYYNKEKNKYYLPANVYAQSNDIRPWEVAKNTTEYYKKEIFVNRFDSNLNENIYYKTNRKADAGKYYASYDHTVWQKIYSDNQEKYILVAELDAAAPTFELITDAPNEMGGSPHFDLSLSSDLNYVYHVPKNWNIILNQYNSEETYTNTTNTYWYYEQDLIDKDKTFNIKEDYPFINQKGFDISARVIKPTINEGIQLNETKSGTQYTIHQYRQINLTVDTYSKNRYFILSKVPKNVPASHTYSIKNSYFIANTQTPTSYIICPLKKRNATSYIPAIELNTEQGYYYIQNDTQAFILSTNDYDASVNKAHGYYELTTYKNSNNERIIQQDKDTKRLDIYLPSIGNAIAMMYDSIFGKPRYRERKIIGYTTIAKLKKYNQQDFADYEIENSQYDLTQAQVNDLTIPVYFIDGQSAGYCSYSYFKNNFIETQTQGSYIILGKQYNGKNENIVYDKTSADVEIPVYKLIDNILGYTSRDNLQIYQKDNEDGNVKILTDICLLSEDEINDLSPELVPGYFDIPVYAITNQNKRPYDEQKLFDTFSAPYDSLYDQDNVSMGWALDALKRYLSELRYLANGGNSQNGLGLQSDWTLDNDQAFGYIYHKPDIITAFVPTADNNIVVGKTYYKKTYDSESNSINYGTESFELVNAIPDDPAANNLYEIPATMLKNAETETYRPEDVVGYIDRITYEVWNNSENGKISTSSTNYYIGNDESKVYYNLTDSDIATLQLYNDGKKTIAVKKAQVTFNNDVSNNPYFIYNGNRYVQAYQTVGQYLFEPIATGAQSVMSCNCYFKNFQQIKVENNVITERKYYFINKMNVQDNVCLVSNGKRVNEFIITLSDSEQLNDEIEVTYSDNTDTYQTQAIESLSRKDFIDYLKDQKNAIIAPTSMTQSQFYEIQNSLSEEQFNSDKESYYIYDNTTQTFSQCSQSDSFNGAINYYKYIGIILPEQPTYEILSTYEENYVFNQRNIFEFDFAQYITRIEQKELDNDSWNKYRNNGTQYYLRSYKPIEQIDYEINTIWNSIKVDD